MRRALLLLALAACRPDAQALPPVPPTPVPASVPASDEIVFADSFDAPAGWTMFEEIVGGNACYGDGIGEVALDGGTLSVWANMAMSLKSNHVIGQLHVLAEGRTGRWRYALRAWIDPATADTGETGPEFSLQNTRPDDAGINRTRVAGIQYRTNVFSPERTWAIWTETGWQVFLTQPLAAGVWYDFVLDVDYTNDRYERLSILGPDVALDLDLSAFAIAGEIRNFAPAFWITAEAENRWNNCGAAGPFECRVRYDDVVLSRRP